MATLESIEQTASSAKETETGWTFTRIATVSGVTGNGMVQFQNAVRVAGIPPMGAPLPSYPSAVVTGRTPRYVGKGKFEVSIDYVDQGEKDSPEDQTIEVGASAEGVEANADVFGNRLQLTYHGKTMPAERIVVLRPRTTLRITRTESESPALKAAKYVGTVNKRGGFRLAKRLNQERCWLCTRLVGRSADNGKSWTVDYEFEYAPLVLIPRRNETRSGWDYYSFYKDAEGNVPTDVADGTYPSTDTPEAIWQMYYESNFNDLRLD